jgi:hypothetical protein
VVVYLKAMKRLACWLGLSLLASCPDGADALSGRASILRTGGTTFQLIPARGQLPYCLAFTQSEKGVTRQLTMSSKNVSFDCKPGKPVGGRSFKAPIEEGPVKMYVLFTSEPIVAATVTQQLLDRGDLSKLSAMDLRLPGRAQLETLEFAPEADMPPAVGEVIGGPRGGEPASDAGPP